MSDALQNVRAESDPVRGGFFKRSGKALFEAHDVPRTQARLPRRLVPAQGRVAAGVSNGVGAPLHLVLEPGPVLALVAGVHESAYGLRQAPRVPRRHHLQPEPRPAATHAEAGHLQRGHVARDPREEPAGGRRCPGGARGERERVALVAVIARTGL